MLNLIAMAADLSLLTDLPFFVAELFCVTLKTPLPSEALADAVEERFFPQSPPSWICVVFALGKFGPSGELNAKDVDPFAIFCP